MNNKLLTLLITSVMTLSAATFNVATTAELRTALSSAATNGEDDTIILADGTYKTTNDGQGTFIYLSNEDNNLTLQGSSADNVILSGDNQHQIFNHNKLDNIDNTVILNNLSFLNANSTNSGGAISSSNYKIIVHNSIFLDNNTSAGSGGAIIESPSISIL